MVECRAGRVGACYRKHEMNPEIVKGDNPDSEKPEQTGWSCVVHIPRSVFYGAPIETVLSEITSPSLVVTTTR